MSEELYNTMAAEPGSSQDVDTDTEVTSSDSTDPLINSTDTANNEAKQQDVTNSDDEEICKNLRKEIFDILTKTYSKTPLNILVVAMTGEGKSSFGTSLRAAITGKWEDMATYGYYGGKDQQMSSVFRKYTKLWLQTDEEFKDIPIPNFFDTQGLPDEDNDSMTEVVQALVEGRIPLDQSLLSVYKLGEKDGVDAIKQCYKKIDESRKIHRILYVTACGKIIPVNLIKAVNAAVHPDSVATDIVKYDIPCFAVRTKMDLTKLMSTDSEDEKDELKRQEKLQQMTGVVGSNFRFCKCTNYCSETTPDMLDRNYPEYDKIFLEFLKVLVNPNIVVQSVNVPLHLQKSFLDKVAAAIRRVAEAICINENILYVLFGAIVVLFLAIIDSLFK